jgi:hypothetical protein
MPRFDTEALVRWTAGVTTLALVAQIIQFFVER